MKLWTLMVRRTREYYLVAVVDMTHHVALAVEALERLGKHIFYNFIETLYFAHPPRSFNVY
jgi:hypothetical protein